MDTTRFMATAPAPSLEDVYKSYGNTLVTTALYSAKGGYKQAVFRQVGNGYELVEVESYSYTRCENCETPKGEEGIL